MKKIIFIAIAIVCAYATCAQNYPDPEFTNEVYFLKKEKDYSVMRLEKGAATMENKIKAAGLGGAEQGYMMDGTRSSIRLEGGGNLLFVYYLGSSSQKPSSKSDSVMQANGIDPNMLQAMMGGANDPSKFTLYKLDVEKGIRKILLMKQGGYFGNHKNQTSEKYTFSIKKIRDGYWVLVPDKPLPKGEYAFSMTDMGGGGGTGMGIVYFAFGVD